MNSFPMEMSPAGPRKMEVFGLSYLPSRKRLGGSLPVLLSLVAILALLFSSASDRLIYRGVSK